MDNEKPKANDLMLYTLKYGAFPKTVKVLETTSGGYLRIEGFKYAFRPASRSYNYSNEYVATQSVHGSVVPYTDTKATELEETARRIVQGNEEKIQQELQRKQEREDRLARELQEVKDLLSNELPIQSQQSLPDGTNLYILVIPIKPCHQRTFDLAIVHTRNTSDYDWSTMEKKPKVGASMTYVVDEKTSFPSCSEVKFDAVEEALWEMVRYRYNDSW